MKNWPKVEQSPSKGKGGWPQVEGNISGKRSSPDSALSSTLSRNNPLDSKVFNKSRPQK